MRTKHTLLAALMLVTAHLWAAPYTDNGDGTVTDTATNLVWQKCSYGQTSDTTCSGTAGTRTWQQALQYCNGLALNGRAWRLPSVVELLSITDKTKSNPSIDATIFPATVSTYYWSSSTYASNVYTAWFVTFYYGDSYNSNKTFNYSVRCVSSGP